MNNKIQLLLLKVRNLIAQQEMVTATANRDIITRDGWRCDYQEHSNDIQKEITQLIQQIQSLMNQQPMTIIVDDATYNYDASENAYWGPDESCGAYGALHHEGKWYGATQGDYGTEVDYDYAFDTPQEAIKQSYLTWS